MPAGRLRERVIFEYRAEDSVGDGGGNFSDATWTPTPAIAAGIRYLTAGETVAAQRLEGRQPVIITVRASAFTRSINAAWRARDARTDVTFNLKAPRPNEDRSYIDFLAVAGGADG